MWIELILAGVLVLLIYNYFKSTNDFWKPYNVRQINNSSFMDKLSVFLGKKTLADLDHVAYKELGDGKFCGIYEMQQPILLVKDMDIVKKVLIKDFEYFVDRRTFAVSQDQKIITKMLGNLTGEEWKGVRAALSPTFTTGKIRRMMDFFNSVGSEWIQHFKDKIEKNGGNSTDMIVLKESTNYTVDVIAAAVFGMKADTISNPNSVFGTMVKRLANFKLWQMIKFGLAVNFPKVLSAFGIDVMDGEAISFFETILSQGMKARLTGSTKLNDFIQIIVEARKGDVKAVGKDELSEFEKNAQISGQDGEAGKKNWLSDDDICNAQMLGFFFAGFTTTSNLISFMIYMLAVNPDVQQKLREEINTHLFTKDDEIIDYDDLNRLTYFDMFVSEVLRKYPPLGRLERVCVKDYEDPSENLKVPKGTLLGVPIQSIHNDTKYYEYPDKFYPEHFTPETKAKRSPYAFLPFGIGPRNCIGMRFALVESKAAIAHILHNFFIEPCSKTPNPVQVKPVGLGVAVPDNLEVTLRLVK